jgi:crotonobetainyl-CoA:carnitine CoA-transferase CaiB-like acyl-CoA transferase
MHLVGHPEVIDEPWFKAGSTRAAYADLLDGYVGDWIAQRTTEVVMVEFEKAEAAVAQIYDVADIFKDEQFNALDTITTVQDPDLGPLRMQNVLYRMSETPGHINWTGRKIGADTHEILADTLGLSESEIEQLSESGIVKQG